MLMQVKRTQQGEVGKVLSSDNLGPLTTFYVDHADNCDKLEEESGVDRLWLVVGSLRKPEGRYVSILKH